jgi:hypothetical protein
MITKWTSHLKSEDEIKRFRNEILGSKNVLKRQLDILNEMKEDAEQHELNTKVYDVPNWDYRQADVNGYKRCLKQISKLINLDQKENNDQSIRPE